MTETPETPETAVAPLPTLPGFESHVRRVALSTIGIAPRTVALSTPMDALDIHLRAPDCTVAFVALAERDPVLGALETPVRINVMDLPVGYLNLTVDGTDVETILRHLKPLIDRLTRAP